MTGLPIMPTSYTELISRVSFYLKVPVHHSKCLDMLQCCKYLHGVESRSFHGEG